MKVAIVAVGYNRKRPLERLIESLLRADYDNDNVDLIISLDFSEQQDDIIKMASAISWSHGKKRVVSHQKNLGLRKHIIKCGDLTEEYDAVVIFEDDIIASETFYIYLKEALSFYENESRLAGISLYSPFINEMAELPFMPMYNEYDAFFIQSAQSWGQCWTKRMWSDFKKWYTLNGSTSLQPSNDMPSKIYSWPESSWKKYFMKYIVETNKYFLYPYVSLSTNASEIGHHNKNLSATFQVPLQTGRKKYLFPKYKDAIFYDVFFEREGLVWSIDGKNHHICVDLYGTKTTALNYDFLLTKKKLSLKKIKSYALTYRPHEANFIYDEPGDQIFLYDLTNSNDINIKADRTSLADANYYSFIPWHTSLLYGVSGVYKYTKRKIAKIMPTKE